MSDAVDCGITVTQIAAMGQPIDATPETTAAFIGRALRGPLNNPVLVRNFGEFRRRFGGSWSRSGLGPAVQQFFDHGGGRLYIVRVANNARGAMLCLPAAGSAMILRAVEPGSTESIRAAVDYDGIDEENEAFFNLTVQRLDPESGLVVDQELHLRVSYEASSERFIGNALLTSTLVRLEAPYPAHRPDATRASGHSIYVLPSEIGSDGTVLSDYDLVGSRKEGTGLFALDDVEHFDTLYLPPVEQAADTGPAAVLAAERYCRGRCAMFITDPPPDWQSVRDAVHGIRELGYASPNMLAYFPRMRLRHEKAGEAVAVGGAIAGLLCKLDQKFGPWQSLNQQGLGFVRKLQPLGEIDEDDMQAPLREGLNIITAARGGQAQVQGSVTLGRGSEEQRMYTSLPIRRLCLRLIASIDAATRWAVFEDHNAELALRLSAQIRVYLGNLYELGAFENDRFIVQCDAGVAKRGLNREQGVTIMLGFHPLACKRPLLLTLHQTASGCRVASSVFAPGNLP